VKRLVAGAAAALLTACGGGGEAGPSDATAPAAAQPALATASSRDTNAAVRLPESFAVRRVAFPGRPADAGEAGASTDPLARDVASARAEALELTLYNPAGASSAGFRLASVHGQGYPTLRAVLQSPHARKPEPATDWSLYCESAVRCTYRAVRRGDPDFTVELQEGAPARLSAADGAIVVSASRISVTVDTTLTLQWWRAGRAGSAERRLVTYLAPRG
jgi:hypothetical protein